jgi:hypothetical protein
MSNLAWVDSVRHHGRVLFIVVTTARKHEDGFNGAWWSLHDEEAQTISWGHSKGVRGTGLSSALLAKKNAKAAAKRYLSKTLEMRRRAGCL